MSGRVVAELGRPETPEETADRKAEASRVYRSSQNARNLVAAVLVTLAVVAVIVFMVPRGTIDPGPAVDPTAAAKRISQQVARPVLALPVEKGWQANQAKLVGEQPTVWSVVYAPDKDSRLQGYVRLEQAFTADKDWVAQKLTGARAADTVDIDGVTWTTYRLPNGKANGNVSYAMGTDVGPDYVLLYGTAPERTFTKYASRLAPNISTARDSK